MYFTCVIAFDGEVGESILMLHKRTLVLRGRLSNLRKVQRPV